VIPDSSRWRFWAAALASGLASSAWLWGGSSLVGPALSLSLPLLVSRLPTPRQRIAVAMAYYMVGGWPIIDAVMGYWGAFQAGTGVAAWLGASALLALPWGLPPKPGGMLAALLLTALPPLGVIGWLSPLTASGVLFPGTGWLGVLGISLLVTFMATPLPLRARWRRVAMGAVLTGAIAANAMAANGNMDWPASPHGWVAVQTRIRPGDGDILAEIQNNQAVIAEGLRQGAGTRVVVFPEAILQDWYAGTRAQFTAAVPPGQVWLLGLQAGLRDAVVRVEHGHADVEPVAVSAGLLLGGDWQPWNPRSLRPAWWQHVFVQDGQRVWAAICVEQVQPWTWLEALWQQPTLILAQSNVWWAAPESAAPRIQEASTRAWVRLMGVPVVVAVNR